MWPGQDAGTDHALRPVSGPAGAVLPRSGRLGAGERYDLTVLRPGTYRYVCGIHPWMSGAVVVSP